MGIPGLKRGTVSLSPHQKSWKEDARAVKDQLRAALGEVAVDIQHIGSTSIAGICAKPIIDLVVGVEDLNAVENHVRRLEQRGFIFRGQDVEGQLLFVLGDFGEDVRTHHIHVVLWDSPVWWDYLNFRDYLNAVPERARTYEILKITLAEQYPHDRGRYTAGKQELIACLLKEAKCWRAQNKERNI